jgi:hypothetical protein
MSILGVDAGSRVRADEAIWMRRFVALWKGGVGRCTMFRRHDRDRGYVHLVWMDVAKCTKLVFFLGALKINGEASFSQ